MSWTLTYNLPWDGLDLDRIRNAVEYIMRSGERLDLLRYEIEPRKPDFIIVFFFFRAALERDWGGFSDVDKNFPLYKIADDDDAVIEIDFSHIPADPKFDTPAMTYFDFYSNSSGNRVFAGVGTEVVQRLSRYLGAEFAP